MTQETRKLYVWYVPNDKPQFAAIYMNIEGYGMTEAFIRENNTLEQTAEGIKREIQEWAAKHDVRLELTFEKAPGMPHLIGGEPPSTDDQEYIRKVAVPAK